MASFYEEIRPVGRPRATPGHASEDVAEEILMAAAELFAEHGFTATPTRAIADAVGLRQASLFHYFARKEDMLIELLDRTVRPTLDVVHRLKLDNYAGKTLREGIVDLTGQSISLSDNRRTATFFG